MMRYDPDLTVPTVPAATVLLLRDGAAGLEVFLLERHVGSDFFGGAYVFPGGKVDEVDVACDRHAGADLDDAARLLGTDTDAARGLMIAAIRETFEEAGVLLATRAGRPVTADDLASPSFAEARRRLASREERFDWRPWLEEHDLVLDLGALVPWSWWITPHGEHKRFDTRFFAAALPAAQTSVAEHDDVEATASLWARPAEALRARDEGRAMVIFPTRRNLVQLAEHDGVADALAAARGRRLQPLLPELSQAEDGTLLVGHPDLGPPEPVL